MRSSIQQEPVRQATHFAGLWSKGELQPQLNNTWRVAHTRDLAKCPIRKRRVGVSKIGVIEQVVE